MSWLRKIRHQVLQRRPVLKVVNPRVGTSVIPLDQGDEQIFYQYLTNKIHSLYFEGSEGQLLNIINGLKEDRGFTIQRMRTSVSRGRGKVMLLHLRFPDQQEVRRVIRLS